MKQAAQEELLVVRRPRFPLHDIPPVWDATGPWKTSLVNAFSFVAPVFEKAACVTVRESFAAIRDPRMLANARAFVQQEAQHSHVHADLNEFLLGNGLEPLRASIDDLLQRTEQHFYRLPAQQRLATVAAGEHIIACFSHWIFDDSFSESMHPTLRALYTWHSLEEVEHASISYDIYHHLHGRSPRSYLCRVSGYLRAIGYVMGGLLNIYRLTASALQQQEAPGQRLRRYGRVARTAVCRALPFLIYFAPLFHPSMLRPHRFETERYRYEAVFAPYMTPPLRPAAADRR